MDFSDTAVLAKRSEYGVFLKKDYYVDNVDLKTAKEMVKQYHYAKGSSKTAVYLHGLYRVRDNKIVGLAWWLPPTKFAAESVNREHWRKVLSLSRMVILPEVPKNACSFLLSKSVKLIRNDARFVSLVTYADESQYHTGGIYRAANWTYVGKMRGHIRWVDADGMQVSQKSTVNRTNQQMLDLGYINTGKFDKHKYVLHLKPVPTKTTEDHKI